MGALLSSSLPLFLLQLAYVRTGGKKYGKGQKISFQNCYLLQGDLYLLVWQRFKAGSLFLWALLKIWGGVLKGPLQLQYYDVDNASFLLFGSFQSLLALTLLEVSPHILSQ